MPIAFALLSSLLWGTGDFLGGRASRRLPVLTVLVMSQGAMLLLIWAVIAAMRGTGSITIEPESVTIAALGGVAGVAGLAAFYRALALGPMSVVPPIAAAGVALPVTVGIVTGGTPVSAIVVTGLVLAIGGVILASIGEGSAEHEGVAVRVSAVTLGLCVFAACCFGLIFVAMDRAAGDTTGGALVATGGVRLGGIALLAVAIAATRGRTLHAVTGARAIAALVAIGLFDTGANLSFAIAAAHGELAVVAVVGSLYPAVTSGLAHVILGERLGRVQLLGVVCALAGVALLALR